MTTSDAPGLTAGLERLRRLDGLVAASLVDPGSGQVLELLDGEPGEGWDRGADPQLVAAGAVDLVQVVGLMAACLGSPGDLEDVIVTLGPHHHLARPLPTAGVDGLVVVATVDRSRTNLALARRALAELGASSLPALPGGAG